MVSVTDTTYNSGVIIREKEMESMYTFGEELKGDKHRSQYCRSHV